MSWLDQYGDIAIVVAALAVFTLYGRHLTNRHNRKYFR